MSIKPIYTQFSCKESDELDLRQANAVKDNKPDIIVLEYPNNNPTPSSELNKYEPKEKPKELVEKHTKGFSEEVLKTHPWAKADTIMWNNVADLWESGHQIKIYSVDAPNELTREWLEVWDGMYPCVKNNWVWWVKIYLRERIMANNMSWILENYELKENPITLIFLQSFHWEHVEFLLTNPSKNDIWEYYFGKFENVNQEDIRDKVKKLNKTFLKYWDKVSDFK